MSGAASSIPPTPTAVAVQAVGRFRAFNRNRVSLRAGLVAAIPVAGMMSFGLAVGNPTWSVTMGVGAMLVGVAWRADGPQVPPIGTMAVDCVTLALATVAGSLTGHWGWLHLIVLVLVCLVAGVATTLGRRGGLIGTQTIIAFVVFGRFPLDAADAFGLALLVLVGGAAQVLLAAAIAYPIAWRRQRAAVAEAYTSLASLAGRLSEPSAPAAAALDMAIAVLGTPALFADPELPALVDLAGVGRRIRLELIVLSAAIEANPAGTELATPALDRIRATLGMIGGAVDNSAGSRDAVAQAAAELTDWAATRERLADQRLDDRIAALAGQVSAAARLAAGLSAPGGRVSVPTGRPTLGSRITLTRLGEDLERMRLNATLHSAAGRHAVRLAVVVAGTELLTQLVALPRGYWAVVAAATVLRPEFGATFTRGAERFVGTIVGVVIATLIAVAIDPGGWGLVAIVAVLSVVMYTFFPASFTLGVAMLTGVIVFLLHVTTADTTQTALYRGLDTVVGGVIGLAAYALWPTWSALSGAHLLANLIDTQRDYLQAVLGALRRGRSPDNDSVKPLARRARIAWTDADAAIELARSEPTRGDSDPDRAMETLAALRRVVYSVHALRLEAGAVTEHRPLPEITALGLAMVDSLDLEAEHLRAGAAADTAPLPPLRRLYREVAWPQEDTITQALRPALDELVDAIDTAAVSVGLDLP